MLFFSHAVSKIGKFCDVVFVGVFEKKIRVFIFCCFLSIEQSNREFCMETVTHSQQNWNAANEQSIKANTLSIYSMKTIMAAIFTQTHCHLFRLNIPCIRSNENHTHITLLTVRLAVCALRHNITILYTRSGHTHKSSIQCYCGGRCRCSLQNGCDVQSIYCVRVYYAQILRHKYFIRFTYSVVMAMSKASNN